MSTPRHVNVSIVTRVVVSIALLAVALGIFAALYFTRELPQRVEHNGHWPSVLVMEAKPVLIARQWEGFGTARPRFSANVPAQVRGLVVEVPNEIVAGARVEQGQVIARIDPTDFMLEIEAIEQRLAEAEGQIAQLDVERLTWLERLELLQEEVQIARTDLERLEEARERIGATQREVDQVRTALSTALRAEVAAREQVERIEPRAAQLRATRAQQQTALRVAQRNLDRTTIMSPMNGYLQSVDVEAGETVNVDQRVARVVRVDRIEVPLRLPASARADLAVGAEVVLESTGARPEQWTANVARIAPEDDERTRTVTVYVEVEQGEVIGGSRETAGVGGALSPGQFVRGVATARVEQLRWVVPRRAIQSDRIRLIDGEVVDSRRVNVDFQIQQRLPQLGLPDTQWAVLAEPLWAGALVVVDGARMLPEGTAAQPVVASLDGSAALARNQPQMNADERRSNESSIRVHPRSSAVSSSSSSMESDP